MKRLRRFARRALRRVRRGRSPSEYVATVDGLTVRFSIEGRYSRRWFLPRYRGGALHEAALTMHLVRLCGPDACFIDVGANLGWFACVVGRHLDGGEVHSFEMDDLSYALLRRNVALNGLDHVRCTLAAVGDREGHATYFRPPGVASPGASVVQKREAFSERVERDMITLDGYCAEHGVAPDVIKIDVEGAEMAVLQGMRDVLRRHRPVLAVEIHPVELCKLGTSASAVVDWLRAAGYTVQAVDGHRRAERYLSLSEVDPAALAANGLLYATPQSA